jgi:hypothetical protein
MGSKQSFLAFLTAECSAQTSLISVMDDSTGLARRTVASHSDARLSMPVYRHGQNRAEPSFHAVSQICEE